VLLYETSPPFTFFFSRMERSGRLSLFSQTPSPKFGVVFPRRFPRFVWSSLSLGPYGLCRLLPLRVSGLNDRTLPAFFFDHSMKPPPRPSLIASWWAVTDACLLPPPTPEPFQRSSSLTSLGPPWGSDRCADLRHLKIVHFLFPPRASFLFLWLSTLL